MRSLLDYFRIIMFGATATPRASLRTNEQTPDRTTEWIIVAVLTTVLFAAVIIALILRRLQLAALRGSGPAMSDADFRVRTDNMYRRYGRGAETGRAQVELIPALFSADDTALAIAASLREAAALRETKGAVRNSTRFYSEGKVPEGDDARQSLVGQDKDSSTRAPSPPGLTLGGTGLDSLR